MLRSTTQKGTLSRKEIIWPDGRNPFKDGFLKETRENSGDKSKNFRYRRFIDHVISIYLDELIKDLIYNNTTLFFGRHRFRMRVHGIDLSHRANYRYDIKYRGKYYIVGLDPWNSLGYHKQPILKLAPGYYKLLCDELNKGHEYIWK